MMPRVSWNTGAKTDIIAVILKVANNSDTRELQAKVMYEPSLIYCNY
jgi:hypothetical protein